MVRLRRYLRDDPRHPRHLLTVRGVGYRFVANPPLEE
jgi:DNA-binding response OmpR family regulator